MAIKNVIDRPLIASKEGGLNLALTLGSKENRFRWDGNR
ncbi:hypothetical protein K227x_26470 [Rubripirellula lacrimiformis]|uniref:Uncharacterized protein n=1 Tax=Rubripirellula lacrimiformis TaxID=1930273 RepID=A0A517NAU7_9BACT|nr:hypothetical protein K227x_26470 [Rubripirellula lacrimiformis]